MKFSLIFVALIFSCASLAEVPERSLSASTKLLDLEPGNRILITEDLKVDQDQLSDLENVLSRETGTGYGSWCYMGDHSGRKELRAGSILVISDVSIEPGNIFKTKYLTINTLSGVTIQCLGSMNKTMKIQKLERIFKGNIRIIK